MTEVQDHKQQEVSHQESARVQDVLGFQSPELDGPANISVNVIRSHT